VEIVTLIYCIPHLCFYPGTWVKEGFLSPLLIILSHFAFIVYKDSQDSTPSNDQIIKNIPSRLASPGNVIAFLEIIVNKKFIIHMHIKRR